MTSLPKEMRTRRWLRIPRMAGASSSCRAFPTFADPMAVDVSCDGVHHRRPPGAPVAAVSSTHKQPLLAPPSPLMPKQLWNGWRLCWLGTHRKNQASCQGLHAKGFMPRAAQRLVAGSMGTPAPLPPCGRNTVWAGLVFSSNAFTCCATSRNSAATWFSVVICSPCTIPECRHGLGSVIFRQL
jgi:hypothetical protein